ncbi:unnamed protein product [Prorocentrum cordatum]|uniref:Uncharacterized protein n=1 Tax=Prorocentrum cordatum TaxID=2364126 RepID=A0ABN9V7C7_9DINO|nr:unnamed protein product [Polarella glacialis]
MVSDASMESHTVQLVPEGRTKQFQRVWVFQVLPTLPVSACGTRRSGVAFRYPFPPPVLQALICAAFWSGLFMTGVNANGGQSERQILLFASRGNFGKASCTSQQPAFGRSSRALPMPARLRGREEDNLSFHTPILAI